jgi:hypothetical protein
VSALEQHGRLIEHTDISHPVVIARYDIHALRRTPPNEICPGNEPTPPIEHGSGGPDERSLTSHRPRGGPHR